MSTFVHLHTHSEYSTLDGASKISALVDKAVEDGMKALAITDHGNMYGAKEFFNYVSKKNESYEEEIKQINEQLKELQKEESLENTEEKVAELRNQIAEILKNAFKPIIGCEVYVASNSRHDKKTKEDASGDHLVLLAKNKIGYHNLIKMVSAGFTEGFYYKPRIDKVLLERYHEGIIVSTACLGGEIPQHIMNGRIKEAEQSILWFKRIFGDDFYLEVQRHETYDPKASQDVFQHQKEVNPILIDFGKKHDIKVIATNDSHFVNEEEAEAHDRLLCISTNANVNDPNRMRYTKQEWFKTQEEMAKIFVDIPEVLINTVEIANKVDFYNINNEAIMPDFPLPEGFSSADDYLTHLTMEGAKHRYKELPDEYLERIEFELETIKTMGYAGYFLIVQDFIWAGKRMGVSVGPGRGSAAGCVVAYCLGITDIDPMKYNLLFERFLNPERSSLPDIDIDFDDDGRAQVLKYVEEKYGKEKVARIITFGTMAAKSAIKDVARVQQMPLSEAERLSKLIDLIPRGGKVNIASAIEHVAEMEKAFNSENSLISDTIKYAKMLEGTVRNVGVHACGIIICRDNLTDHVPICTATDKETGEDMFVTQYEGTLIEGVGMIKMDFLGLKTLSIIKDAVENIEQSKGIKIEIDTIPIDDQKTYELYCNGQTVGTFQFESDGMRQHLRNLKPTKFEDLIAMSALYRPGPMDYIPDFIDRKHGRKKIEYDLPEMEEYLNDTYGITVYQEQVMLLSRKLAGLSRGQSDELRKAMGKKDVKKMNPLKEDFIEGCKKNGHAIKKAEKIWEDWEKFASYAFNKSHATCYSWIAYQTAYLKANYPAEYMSAVLSRNKDNITEITKFMDECRNMGMQVLGPDVNESNLKFTVNKSGNIRFGLGAIKGVGENAVANIVEECKKRGAFTSIFDFVERVNLSICNRKTMESLALAGAFDNMKEITREQFFTQNSKGEIVLDTIIRYGNKIQADRATISNSLFGGSDTIEIAKPEIPAQIEEWSSLERLNKEREVIGIYLSAHPLDEYYVELNYLCNTPIANCKDIEQIKGKKLIKAGGIVTGFRTGMTKKGNQFGAITIEDFSGANEFMLFGDDFVEYSKYQIKDLYVYIQGSVETRRNKWDQGNEQNPIEEFKIKKMGLLGDLSKDPIEKLTLSVDLMALDKEFVDELTAVVAKNQGKTHLFLKIMDSKNQYNVELFARGFQINVNKEFISFLHQKQEQFKLNNFDLVLP